uniref:Uncharacterized protein n=1 Tax=Gossypium raimondii TaxID=29730 RepID=A0A0D2RVZ2_GOSRA|nr:hypothetical protein B456_004G090100 [Gossypium raimondii]
MDFEKKPTTFLNTPIFPFPSPSPSPILNTLIFCLSSANNDFPHQTTAFIFDFPHLRLSLSKSALHHQSAAAFIFLFQRCSGSTNSSDNKDQTKTPFGYTRKDVLLIDLGVTVAGVGLKSGLEFVGVDPLQAGNVVQLVMVLGLTVGWISTYIFRVSNKEMTYAQQLRDYKVKAMQKRLEGLTEAKLEALLEQVEEEKQRQASGEQVN